MERLLLYEHDLTIFYFLTACQYLKNPYIEK